MFELDWFTLLCACLACSVVGLESVKEVFDEETLFMKVFNTVLVFAWLWLALKFGVNSYTTFYEVSI